MVLPIYLDTPYVQEYAVKNINLSENQKAYALKDHNNPNRQWKYSNSFNKGLWVT